MDKRHCREDGWLCEPGTRCDTHLGDPTLTGEYLAGFAAGYRQGWDQRGLLQQLPSEPVDD